jgi:hypothetical protein
MWALMFPFQCQLWLGCSQICWIEQGIFFSSNFLASCVTCTCLIDFWIFHANYNTFAIGLNHSKRNHDDQGRSLY